MNEKQTQPQDLSVLPENPYRGLLDIRKEVGNSTRLNVDIINDDYYQIKSVSPRHGTLQTIVALYVKRVILELKSAELNTYSPEGVAKFNEIINRLTAPLTSREDHKSNDLGRTLGIHQPHQDTTNCPADSTVPVPQGKQNRKPGRKKATSE